MNYRTNSQFSSAWTWSGPEPLRGVSGLRTVTSPKTTFRTFRTKGLWNRVNYASRVTSLEGCRLRLTASLAEQVAPLEIAVGVERKKKFSLWLWRCRSGHRSQDDAIWEFPLFGFFLREAFALRNLQPTSIQHWNFVKAVTLL